MLARATSQRADFPPIGCEDCHWEAVDLDSSGDCVVAACAWELRRLLPEALLVAHGLLTLGATWDAKLASGKLRLAAARHLARPEVLRRVVRRPHDTVDARTLDTVEQLCGMI